MNALVGALLVGVLTYLGRTARGKPMSIDIVVGIAALALMLALLEQVNQKLARDFVILAVLATALAHWEVIAKASGLEEKKKK